MATVRILLKKITSELKLAERKSALLQNNNVWKKKFYLCSVLQDNPAVASSNEQLYEQMTSNPAFREKYTKTQRLSVRFSSEAKIFGHVSHFTELVRKCLACQHLDFNSADWTSDNLHVISSRHSRTIGKEYIFQFSRRSWGRNAWRTPENVCVGGYWNNRLPRIINPFWIPTPPPPLISLYSWKNNNNIFCFYNLVRYIIQQVSVRLL